MATPKSGKSTGKMTGKRGVKVDKSGAVVYIDRRGDVVLDLTNARRMQKRRKDTERRKRHRK